jgi:hypothetical protein
MDLEIDEESCPVSEEIVDLDQAGGSTEVDFLSARWETSDGDLVVKYNLRSSASFCMYYLISTSAPLITDMQRYTARERTGKPSDEW